MALVTDNNTVNIVHLFLPEESQLRLQAPHYVRLTYEIAGWLGRV